MPKTKILRQTITFKNATPQEVYDLLMDSKKHTAFSGAVAKISPKVGGTFTAYDDYASGKNIALVPGKKIVQTWRASDWPKDAISKTTYLFTKVGTGTKISFMQTGVPAEQFDDIAQGWFDYYWIPMQKYLTVKQKK